MKPTRVKWHQMKHRLTEAPLVVDPKTHVSEAVSTKVQEKAIVAPYLDSTSSMEIGSSTIDFLVKRPASKPHTRDSWSTIVDRQNRQLLQLFFLGLILFHHHPRWKQHLHRSLLWWRQWLDKPYHGGCSNLRLGRHHWQRRT